MSAPLSLSIESYTLPPSSGLPPLSPPHRRTMRPKCFQIRQPGWICQSSQGLKHTTDRRKVTNPLCYIAKERSGYIIEPCNALSTAVSQSGSEFVPHQLAIGNQLRLGRITFVVHNIQSCMWKSRNAQASKAQDTLSVMSLSATSCKRVDAHPYRTCRICLESTEKDVVNVCRCKGSIGGIHIECLKNWVEMKLIVRRQANVVNFTWKEFRCELCHEQYPETMIVNEAVHQLLRMPLFTGKYVVLGLKELVGNDKVVYVVLENEQTSLGSAANSSIRVNDFSVASCHAVLKWNEAGPYIEDSGSALGTWVILNQRLFLKAKESRTLQSNGEALRISVKKRRSFRSLLCGGST